MPAFIRAALIAAPLLAGAVSAHADPAETVLYSFGAERPAPYQPYGRLIIDLTGNLFGTLYQGGIHPTYGSGLGGVFELTPPGPGQTAWTQKVIYQFGANIPDGATPYGALTSDAHGNLFMTTLSSFLNPGPCGGCGAVIELSPPAPGQAEWSERVLHLFGNRSGDGTSPYGGILVDLAGNLYATTFEGGAYRAGAVVKLTPTAKGGYTEKVIYSFGQTQYDGTLPAGDIAAGPNGTLLMTTENGGRKYGGTVVALSPPHGDDGVWRERVVHSFDHAVDGSQPSGAPVFDAAGNFYVVCPVGGPAGAGTVVEFSPDAANSRSWTETLVHGFAASDDVSNPRDQVAIDKTGALFVTGGNGGSMNYGGVVKLIPPTAGGTGWTQTILHRFVGRPSDGASPGAGVIADSSGTLYTTTADGGSSNRGTVVELTGTGFVPNGASR